MAESAELSSAGNLARNIRALRETHGLTQRQLSERSGVPRPTLATLESGSANPTLQVLVKVAGALEVSIEELIGPPRDTGRHWRRVELPRRFRQGVEVSKLLPDRLGGLDIERLALPPGGSMRGAPHTAGTREYCFCETGSLVLTASGQSWTLEAGDVVAFRGDQKHSYRNAADHAPAVAICVILLAPIR